MTTGSADRTEASTRAEPDRAQSLLSRELAPLALRGLEKMVLPERHVFCDIARSDAAGGLHLLGESDRYTAMVMIGLAAQQPAGVGADLPVEGIWDRLVEWATSGTDLGGAGLVLWGLVLGKDGRAEAVARAVVQRQDKALARLSGFQSMPLGWALTGLSEAIGAGVGGQGVRTLARRVRDRLFENRCDQTGLFCFGTPPGRRNVVKARTNRRLGSFASQVYPSIGLARYATAGGDRESLAAAVQCADRIVSLQGPQGQWWWVYHVRSARPAIKYPVYSIHQDAMGPMALLAVHQAGGPDYDEAIRKGLLWIERHPECPEAQLIDNDLGVVWRAIQRDDPRRTGPLGLGLGERFRMNVAAWVGGADTRRFRKGFVCDECRPYHLGWILLAAAMAAAEEQ